MKQTRRDFTKLIGTLFAGLPFLGSEVLGLKGPILCEKAKKKNAIIDELYAYIKTLPENQEEIDYDAVVDAVLDANKRLGEIDGKTGSSHDEMVKSLKVGFMQLSIDITKRFEGLSNVNGIYTHLKEDDKLCRLERTRDTFVFYKKPEMYAGQINLIDNYLVTDGEEVLVPIFNTNLDEMIGVLYPFLNGLFHKIVRFKIHMFVKSDGIGLVIVDDVPMKRDLLDREFEIQSPKEFVRMIETAISEGKYVASCDDPVHLRKGFLIADSLEKDNPIVVRCRVVSLKNMNLLERVYRINKTLMGEGEKRL